MGMSRGGMTRSMTGLAPVVLFLGALAGCASSPPAKQNPVPRPSLDDRSSSPPVVLEDAWVPVDETSAGGYVLVLGTGEGADASDARNAALADARARAAAIIGVEVNSALDHIVEEAQRSQGGELDSTFVQETSSRVHARTQEFLRGEVPVPPERTKEISAGRIRVALRLRYPRSVLYPRERLDRILARKGSPETRAKAAIRLAEDYRSEGAHELSVLAARFAVLWAPSSSSGWRLLADLHEDAREYLAAVIAVERLSELLPDGEAIAVRKQADQLRRLLPSPEAKLADLVSRVEVATQRGGLEVECGVESGRFAPRFENERAGYIECVWIDDVGPAAWRPTARDRASHLWSIGRHTLLPMDTPWDGPVVVLWFLTKAPLDFTALLEAGVSWPLATSLEKLERLEQLERAIDRALEDPDTRTEVCRLTP